MSTDLDMLRGSRAAQTKLKQRVFELEQLLKLARQQRAEAVERAKQAERERDGALADLEAHSAPEPHGPSIFALEYLELMRAHKLVKQLYAAPDGEYAAVGNRVLAMIASICEAADPGRKGKRDAA